MDRTTKPMLAALQRELPVGSYVYELAGFGRALGSEGDDRGLDPASP